MSHSQFHSTDLFILRHAWLNLWDKHMTTGRINQVSYSDTSVAKRKAFISECPTCPFRHIITVLPVQKLISLRCRLANEFARLPQNSARHPQRNRHFTGNSICSLLARIDLLLSAQSGSYYYLNGFYG